MLDWRIEDDDNWAWEADGANDGVSLTIPPVRQPTAEPRQRRHLLGLLLIGLLALVTLGYRSWQGYEDDVIRLPADIQRTVDLETWAWYNHDGSLTDALIDDQAPQDWAHGLRWLQYWRRKAANQDCQLPQAVVRKVERHGDLALVEVVLNQPGLPWMPTPYREYRMYRHGDNRWLRTAPDPKFWGSHRTLETEHFRIEFRQRDAEAVEAMATDVEMLYASLRRDVGLGPPPAGEKLSIEVVMDVVPLTEATGCYPVSDSIMVPTPVLLQVPVGLSDAAVLRDAIRCPLAKRVLYEATERTPVKPTWTALVKGLEMWLSSHDSALPPARHYVMEQELQQRLATGSMTLADLNISSNEPGGEEAVKAIAAATVLDHAVAAHGRSGIPALVGGLTDHESWTTLIPSVFGLPAAQFEAGWQAYLADYSTSAH
jgi:hypothetical protein